ncbi:MAG: alpha/beta hydrolase [Kiloniellales bacterium]|nr:alpha/beta hydrolase [Kiloniellales bacterium]
MTGGRARTGLRLLALLLLAPLAACGTPEVAPPGPWAENGGGPPSLADDSFTARDGLSLPLRRWLPEARRPRGVFLALHGFNDYSKAFESPGEALAARGFAVYAYDQRGFGQAPHRGLWPGIETMTRDAADLAGLLRKRYPESPLYLIGESMGGAVLMAATAGPEPLDYDALILSSPAVWSRETMPFYQTWSLWLGIRLFPSLKVSGGGYKIQASDNVEMLIGLGRDPLFIKETRVDALYGLTNLMDRAYESADRLPGPALLLYGERDQIVPKNPTLDVWRRLPKNGKAEGQRIALYEDGWHLLLRDLRGEEVLEDILAWLEDPEAPLPSGADANAVDYLASYAAFYGIELSDFQAADPQTSGSQASDP